MATISAANNEANSLILPDVRKRVDGSFQGGLDMDRINDLSISRQKSADAAVPEDSSERLKSRHNADPRGRVLLACLSLVIAGLCKAGQAVDAKGPQAGVPSTPQCVVPGCAAAVAATSHPNGGQVVSGTGSITQSGNTTTIRQSSTDLS